jgi:5-methyltetrahydrofolate--homocysteine methyltransferase
MSILVEIKEATIAGDRNAMARLTKSALGDGIEADQIIKDGFIAAMGVVGEEFGAGRIYIPEMLIASRAMKTGLEIVRPFMTGGKVETIARVVLGTVQGDLHDIGKNLVGMLLEGSGMEVIDLGVDVAPEQIVEAVNTHQPEFVGLSALLTTTMDSMEASIGALDKAGLKDKVKVLVGGAPISQEFANQIGADGYGKDAAAAVKRIKELVA